MTAPSVARPRKAWAACLLSLLTPGLGHLYAGRLGAAVGAFVLAHVVLAAATAVGAFVPWPPYNTLLMAAGILGAYAGVAWWAYRVARRAPPDYLLRPFNHWHVCLLAVLVAVFGVRPLYTALMRRYVVHAYRIPTRSMQPTLLVGDFVFVREALSRPAVVARGEIVVHESVTQRGTQSIKRAVGTPGDTLEMIRGRLLVNGAAETAPRGPGGDVSEDVSDSTMNWQRRFLVAGVDSASYHPSRDTWGPIVVPRDAYFVLGDNRDNSYDSRYWGFLPAGAVVGRPIRIYLSVESSAGSTVPFLGKTRWDRVGRAVR